MRAMPDEVAITRVSERHACLQVDGVVKKDGRWVKASFTVHKPDVLQMTNEEFRAFALRNLPHVTADIRWETHV